MATEMATEMGTEMEKEMETGVGITVNADLPQRRRLFPDGSCWNAAAAGWHILRPWWRWKDGSGDLAMYCCSVGEV